MRTLILLSVALTMSSCTYAPLHDLPVRPDFIKAGVKPGDTVEIETKDGSKYKFEVTAVSAVDIEGDGVNLPVSEIEKIGVRSWEEPEHPCGAGQPVGCSIPEVVLALSELYRQQADKFHNACVAHDFCYRHGYATYGIERAECDDGFYQDMQDECSSMGAFSVLDVKNYSLCQLAAKQTVDAVRRYGEPAYRTTTSTYCEYR